MKTTLRTCCRSAPIDQRRRALYWFLFLAVVGFCMAWNLSSPNGIMATGLYVVNSTADTADANTGDGVCADAGGQCTLRAALAEVAFSPVSMITFDLATPATILLTTPLPVIATAGVPLHIQGAGTDQLTIDGAEHVRPFVIAGNAHGVTISELTVANGFTQEDGGAIYARAPLTLTNVHLINNYAALDGGAIFTQQALTLNHVTIAGNTAAGNGGGVMNWLGTVEISNSLIDSNDARSGGGLASAAGIVRLTDSTLSNNHATGTFDGEWHDGGDGGGLYLAGGEGGGLVALRNSTLSNNVADGDGGGIFNSDATVNLVNSTISGNRAMEDGGGIVNIASVFPAQAQLASSTVAHNFAAVRAGGIVSEGGLFTGQNSIIADNHNESGSIPDCRSTDSPAFAFTYTLIGNDSGCVGAFDDGVGNVVGNAGNPIDPNLGRLADNGGATKTHALLTGGTPSPARDAGDPAGCTDLDGSPLLTDQRGAARLLDSDSDGTPRCDMGAFEAGLGNDTWPRARRLTFTGSITGTTATASQPIDKLGQSRWYKFAVEPGSKVTVNLTDLPANYDVTIYKDIQAIYASLTAPATNQELVQLTAEFAPDAYSPDAYSPDAYSPDAYSPDAYSPDAYSPDAYSPDAYSPDAYSPDAYSPDAYSPDAYSPDAYSPDAYSPDAYSPDAYSPDAYSPDLAYSNAQARSLIGVSAFEGLADETVTVNTWDNSGDFYVRVRGRNGAFDASNPFTLTASLSGNTCTGINPALPNRTLSPVAGNYRTLILADFSRMDASDPLLPSLQTALAAFAARAEINGALIDVGTDAAVAAANRQADALTTCPAAKNLVVNAIGQIIAGYRTANPTVEYIVLIGNDDVIPFYRYPDRALLANEKNYVPPVDSTTASYASLRLGYVLSQDIYGTSTNLSLNNTTLPIPDLPVGRLVETPADVLTMLAAYNATVTAGTPGQLPTPQSALVTGYDFLEDAALAIQTTLEAGMGGAADTLITPRSLSPLSDDPRVWSADDLRAALLDNRHDLIFLAGHFSAASALAADYRTRLLSTEVTAASVDLQNALIFSVGCHSGYNIVNDHGIPNVTREPDWAQTFAQKGATLIAGTGYQYGDTDFLAYAERLYLQFSQQLLVGEGPVPIGKALVAAKQLYLAETANLRGIHEKTVLQATLFGLPMLSVNMPAGRTVPTQPESIIEAVYPSAQDPGATLGLLASDVITIAFKPKLNLTTLTNVTNDETATVAHISDTDGVVSNPGEPVLPFKVRNVSVPNTVLRGVGLRGGSYTDLPNVIPLTGAATTEVRGVHPPFLSAVFFPIQPWRVNYFDQLGNQSGGVTRLTMTPAQFRSDDATGSTGTLRQWNNMALRFYYSANTTTYAAGSVPALAAPPAITKVTADSTNGGLHFRVTVVGDPAAGIQEVWITYTIYDCSGCHGTWQSFDLVRNGEDSTVWEGVLPLQAPSAQVRYMVQAVNGVGLVALHTNQGEYFVPDIDPAAPTTGTDPATTTLDFQSVPSTGAYSAQVTFQAQLRSNGAPVADQPIRFALGAQQRRATTNASGVATVTIPLLSEPGTASVRATFAGNRDYLPAAVSSPFVITKQATQLTLSTVDTAVPEGADPPLVATLRDGNGNRLREKSVFFIVRGNGTSYTATDITNFVGEARLGPVPLPPGIYTVDLYFSGTIPPPAALELVDINFLPTATSGTLTIVAANQAPTAVDDSYATGEDRPLIVSAPGVLGNDTDPELNALTAILVREPRNGTLQLNVNGAFTYTPTANFSGSDHFTYKANDGTTDSNVATVTITVNAGANAFATCGGYAIFETAPGRYVAPDFAGTLIVGTARNDWLLGSEGPDLILGLAGADDILGRSGNDVICGGPGVDIIKGSDGVDRLYGDSENDWLIGGDGADILYGGPGMDDLEGNDGADQLFGEAGSDVLLGGAGNDELEGGEEIDYLFGQGDSDRLHGGQEDDHLFGGADRDELYGEEGADLLGGGNGADLLFGGNGPDRLFGGDGDDALNGGADRDLCIGGNGTDSLVDCEDDTDPGEVDPWLESAAGEDVDESAARTANDGNGENAIPNRITNIFLPLIVR